jgi:hypothetical protein
VVPINRPALTSFACEAYDARLRVVLEDLEARGGVLELGLEPWSTQLRIPTRSLARLLRRLEALGVIAIERRGNIGSAYGGRSANFYRSLLTWAQFEARAAELRRARSSEVTRARQRRYRERRKLEHIADRALDRAADGLERARAIAEVYLYPDDDDANDDDLRGWY